MIKNWNEIWWSMAGGDYTQYMQVKGMESLEFFEMYDLHKKKIEELIQQNRNRTKNGK